MAVTSQMVKELREKTGAGMMDCKRALDETQGDMEGAIDWLRKKGLSAAAKKAGRVAAEGKVMALSGANRGVLVEVNTETDFTAKNDKFIQYAETATRLMLEEKPADLAALASTAYPGTGRTVGEELQHLIATIGENMTLRRAAALEVNPGVVASYIHMGGKIGVLVALESAAGNVEGLQEFGRKVAMHVAANNPGFLKRDEVPATVLEREKSVLTEQAKASGKPEAIIEKMVQGRIAKFYGEVCLVDQPYVMDPNVTVTQAAAAVAKELGASITITGFVRFALGEGIERQEKDFAKEVAVQLGG